jgi:hypothetical protein
VGINNILGIISIVGINNIMGIINIVGINYIVGIIYRGIPWESKKPFKHPAVKSAPYRDSTNP